ncbi:pseudouridine synthase [Treponema sp.]|uniref:pseudouridine synthase n=1 Tax=Treponema sp. TaxID=166 RepID=UPI003F0ADC6A
MEPKNSIQILLPPSTKNPFLVLRKPRHIPSAPLFENDESAFTAAASLYPFLLDVRGKKESEHGLVHRIDTETAGLLLIAATQESYSAIMQSQKNGLFVKGYTALCQEYKGKQQEGFPPFEFEAEEASRNSRIYTVSSRFRPFSRKSAQVRPVTENSGRAANKKSGEKIYTTRIVLDSDNFSASCRITQGYRHQVRCHLAWMGFPVRGDRLYNPLSRPDEKMQFFADYISFPHPLTGRTVEIKDKDF